MIGSFNAFSAEFTHIKLNPEFEQALNAPRPSVLNKSLQGKNSSIPASSSKQTFDAKIFALLGSAFNGGIDTPVPVDGQNSPLYEEINRQLQNHREIGQSEVNNINRMNQQFNLGSANFSGFSWQRPFGVVQVYVDRQVTPNIFGENWLVQDRFTIGLEATTFLERANSEGITSMSDTEIAAFAGVTFKRVYTYYHYATSYQDGLQSDFSKLFLSFSKFNETGMEEMTQEEILKREDQWTVSAGGMITTPPLYNISFSGGVLAKYDYEVMTSIQSSTTKEPNELRFKIGVLSKKTTSSGVTAELQLDFFQLLQLTILRYDLNYEYASGKEYTLGFTNDNWKIMRDNPEQHEELRNILTGSGQIRKLEPYVVRLDEASSEQLDQRGSILIWGKLQKSKTEQIRVIKDKTVHLFFKNYSQSVKVVQNIISRLFSAIVYKLLKFPVGATNAAIFSRQLTMEYEATHPQASDPSVIRLDNQNQFSFELTQYYNAARTDRWIDRVFKNDAIWFVDNFTTLPKDYKTSVRQELLKGPMLIESTLKVDQVGFAYLVAQHENTIFSHLAKVCDSSKKQDWITEDKRRALLKSNLFGNEKCVKDLGLKFISFKKDYDANFLRPSLAQFKNFVTGYYKLAEGVDDLTALFGPQNTFIHGKLQATTSSGAPFLTTFSAGQFRGLGVIDTFKRNSTSRVPASIVSE